MLIWHTCAVMNNGDLKCWGANGLGALGDGTTTDSTTPVTVDLFDGECAAIAKAKLTLTKMNTAPGDDGLTLSGEMLLPHPFSPAVNPVMNGVRLSIYRPAGQGAVLDDVVIPSGGYDPVTKKEWKANGAGTTFTYMNMPNDLPSRINKVQVKVQTRTPGLIKLSAKGRRLLRLPEPEAGNGRVQPRAAVGERAVRHRALLRDVPVAAVVLLQRTGRLADLSLKEAALRCAMRRAPAARSRAARRAATRNEAESMSDSS